MEVPFQAHTLAKICERHLPFETNGKIYVSKKVLLKEGLNFDEIDFAFAFLRKWGICQVVDHEPVYELDFDGTYDIDLEDRGYRFSVDRDRLHALITEAVSDTGECISIFDEKTSKITIGRYTIELPPSKNEYQFCRAMFKRTVREFVDWSTIYEEIDGEFDVADKQKAKKKIRDTMRALRQRIDKATTGKVSPLFDWKIKSIRRNY